MINYYKVLGVHKLATAREIKSAWTSLASVNHPDKTGNDPVAADRMAIINAAYTVLKDSKERKRYDNMLMLTGTACSACEGKGASLKQKGFSRKITIVCTICKGVGVIQSS